MTKKIATSWRVQGPVEDRAVPQDSGIMNEAQRAHKHIQESASGITDGLHLDGWEQFVI